MNITNAQYIKDIVDGVSTDTNITVSCTINGSLMMVPVDTNNKHYVEILKQVAAETLTIAAADEE